jgi:hypothetical protein
VGGALARNNQVGFDVWVKNLLQSFVFRSRAICLLNFDDGCGCQNFRDEVARKLIRPIERLLQSNTVDLSGCKTKSRPME